MKSLLLISTVLWIGFYINGNFKMKKTYDVSQDNPEKITKTDQEWKEELTPEQYRVTRLKGTERPFTGQYYDFYEKGHYVCICCGTKLFDSGSKFASGCGWPSFSEKSTDSISFHKDTSFGMTRTEFTCSKCDAHLGHVFNDGPPPTGLRYCINSGC